METKTVNGTVVNARNGQELEEGKFLVRELTQKERDKLPPQVAKHEGPNPFGTQRLYVSVDSQDTHGGFYVLAWE